MKTAILLVLLLMAAFVLGVCRLAESRVTRFGYSVEQIYCLRNDPSFYFHNGSLSIWNWYPPVYGWVTRMDCSRYSRPWER
jgi:hypothetical protein